MLLLFLGLLAANAGLFALNAYLIRRGFRSLRRTQALTQEAEKIYSDSMQVHHDADAIKRRVLADEQARAQAMRN